MSRHVLDESQADIASLPMTRFTGLITGLYGDVLQGWALDTLNPSQRLIVEIYIDGASVAVARADLFEARAPEGDQFNGFAVQLRQSWLNQARHITVKIANEPVSLPGDITLPAPFGKEPELIASQVWHTGGLRISGWAWDPQAPQRRVTIRVREDDRQVAQAVCDQHSQALAYRDSSDHGFVVDLPWAFADGRPHILSVESDSGEPLAGSPITLCCTPEGIEGLIRQLDPHNNNALLATIQAVAEEQNLKLPKSAGWHLYEKWLKTFQDKSSNKHLEISKKIGILLITEGNSELENLSLRSIPENVQSHPVALGHPDNLMQAVKNLLKLGCEQVVPLHAGDRLAIGALPMLGTLLGDSEAWCYADCDKYSLDGEQSSPWFKPAWDMDLYIGADIFSPGCILSRQIVIAALESIPERASSRLNWHLFFAAVVLASEASEKDIRHLPAVLYHRHVDQPATPELAAPSDYRHEAISWLCDSLEAGALVTQIPAHPSLLRVQWPLPQVLPKVTLIVPTRDQVGLLTTCIDGLLHKTDYPDLEIIVVDNQSSDQAALDFLKNLPSHGVRVLSHPYPFNYSTINNAAVMKAEGELIGLVNNDIEIIDSTWLKEMVSQLRPGVGAVGAKLLWPNGMVQHAGVVVGINGLAAHTGNSWTDTDAGYLAFNQLTRRQSAVTAACLLTRKETYLAVGGLDEQAFPVAFNDVDFCMKLNEQGLALIWTPFAKLIHAESASRGKDQTPEKRARAIREQKKFIERWTVKGWQDSFYHPALSHDYLSGPFGGLALPPLISEKLSISGRSSRKAHG
ncbi:glycosyltransferase family 2 protein [Enterobacterales bacterium AW_CKDN230030176-1A_HGKHYDSX7]